MPVVFCHFFVALLYVSSCIKPGFRFNCQDIFPYVRMEFCLFAAILRGITELFVDVEPFFDFLCELDFSSGVGKSEGLFFE